MGRLVPVPPERQNEVTLAVPAEVASQLLSIDLQHAGHLIGAGYPEDCVAFLKANNIKNAAVNSPKFMAKVERALETSLRKGLDQNATYILDHFPAVKDLMTSPKMQECAYRGALLKTKQGYLHFAKNNLVMTGQDPSLFFTDSKTQAVVTAGLSAMLHRDKDGMPALTRAIAEYNIPREWVQTRKFQAEVIPAIETRVAQIRSNYHHAGRRMQEVIDLIDATDIKELLPKKASPQLPANIAWIVQRLERDGYADRAAPIREYFGMA